MTPCETMLYWPHTSALVAYNGGTSVGYGPVKTLFLEPDFVPSTGTLDVGHGHVRTLFLGIILSLVPMTPCETMLYWPSPCGSTLTVDNPRSHSTAQVDDLIKWSHMGPANLQWWAPRARRRQVRINRGKLVRTPANVTGSVVAEITIGTDHVRRCPLLWIPVMSSRMLYTGLGK